MVTAGTAFEFSRLPKADCFWNKHPNSRVGETSRQKVKVGRAFTLCVRVCVCARTATRRGPLRSPRGAPLWGPRPALRPPGSPLTPLGPPLTPPRSPVRPPGPHAASPRPRCQWAAGTGVEGAGPLRPRVYSGGVAARSQQEEQEHRGDAGRAAGCELRRRAGEAAALRE